MSGADVAESTKRFLNSIGCSGEIPSLPIGANLDIPLTGAPVTGSVPQYPRFRFMHDQEVEKRDPHSCPDDFMRPFIDRTHDFSGSFYTNNVIDCDDEEPYTDELNDPDRIGTGIFWDGKYILRDHALEITRDTARFRRILDRRYAAYLNQDDADTTIFELMTEFMGFSVSMFDPMEALKEYCKDNPGAEEAFKGILAMGNRSSETKSPSMICESPKKCAVSNQTSVPTNPPSLLPQYNRRERRERGARNKKR